MSNETRHHHHDSAQADYEQQDLSLRPIFIALIGLAVVCLVVALLVVGVYKVMDRVADSSEPAQNPLATKIVPDSRYATKKQFDDEIEAEFPKPQLEKAEGEDLLKDRIAQDTILSTYGPVEGKPGVVRIPITRAMELVAQRGLPILPKNAANTGASKKGGAQ